MEATTKPRVKIEQWSIHYSLRRGGMELTGIALNHPILGHNKIWTSRIIRIDLDKFELETLNTIYELEKE